MYLSPSTSQLKIIAPDFPTVGATASVSDCVTPNEITSSNSHKVTLQKALATIQIN